MMGPFTHLFAKEDLLRIEAFNHSIPARWSGPQALSMWISIAVLALFAGCATAPQPVTPEPIPGYRQLQEEFGPRDFGPLAGRRVVLDPGHGGFFRGALGPDGLPEAEVNMGVALHLRGLLEWAGAEVTLTRTADYDFLAGSDSTLAADLAFRVSLTDSLQPDVFLSIHHNSTASRDETINETQTYYPLGDEGASLDLARAVHRHLVRNLEISPARILPGNFHVLRNATVPAVLGEPAMLSNPVMEDRLSLAASQKLEAQAYFLGLLDYFADGTPAWSGAAIDTVYLEDTEQIPVIRWTFQPEGRTGPGERLADDLLDGGGPGPDPTSFGLRRDGAAEGFHLSADGYTLSWRPIGPLPPHPIELVLSGRNLAGRAAPLRRTVVVPPWDDQLSIRVLGSQSPSGTVPQLVHWRSVSGFPVPPGTLTLGTQPIHRLAGGLEGWLAIEPTDTEPRFDEAEFLPDGAAQASTVPIGTDALPSAYQWRLLDGTAAGVDLTARLPIRPWQYRPLYGDEPAPAFLTDPTRPAVPVRTEQPTWITLPGFYPLVSTGIATPDEAGTVPVQTTVWPVEPLLPAVVGRVIVLDPAGGEGDSQGAGPLGLRGADINLAVARYAQSLLIGAGAEVHLTRSDGTLIPDPDKVRLAGRVGADLFLTIGRQARSGQITAAHHPGSVVGEAWARHFLHAWAPLTVASDSLSAAASWAYLLRHTACPALAVSLPGPSTAEDEILLGDATWQRAEARAILLAVAAVLGQEPVLETTVLPPAIAENLDTGFPRGSIDWMVLDGNFLWNGGVEPLLLDRPNSTLPPGVDFPLSSGHGPGLPALGSRHTLEIHAGSRWQLWLLHRIERGWESRLMLQGP
jgi:N-acetylmuramoyl-L-alanine amidase